MDLTPKFRENQIVAIEAFLSHHLAASGRRGLVLGLSGGLDSCVVAKLCANAVGQRNVLGLMLKDDVTGSQDIKDAREWAKRIGVTYRELGIGPVIKSFRESLKLKPSQRTALGNVKARCRMTMLYNVSAIEKRLVIGTSNKSEILTGYYTKFGDGGADLLPIGDLYKTQVREMARFLKVPRCIITKIPSADLWRGQTDEAELGLAYSDLDRILLGIELQLNNGDIYEKTGISVRNILKVRRLVRGSVHKRKMPLIPKLGIRTIGLDWRE